ncbi:hypothetical protein H9P43_006465 [Blastocladiella emersonii ATCC 22665]|nr:hypothetical protein H9P43_006465 [Blastocladiella emersonii ATCC 22665]
METALESLQLDPANAAAPLSFAALPSDLTARVVQLAAPHHRVLTASRELLDAMESHRVKLTWINTLCELKTPAAARAVLLNADRTVRTNLCAYLELDYLAEGNASELPARPGLDALVLAAARCPLVELQPALNRCGDRNTYSPELIMRAQSILINEVTRGTPKIQLFTAVPVNALFQLIAFAAVDRSRALLGQLVVCTAQNALEFTCLPISIIVWMDVSVKCCVLPWRDLMKAAPKLDWRLSLPTWIAITAMLSGNGPAFGLMTKGRLSAGVDDELLLELGNNDQVLELVFDCLKEPYAAAAGGIIPILDWTLLNVWPEGGRENDGISLWSLLVRQSTPEPFAHVLQHHTKILTKSIDDTMFPPQVPTLVAGWCKHGHGLHALGVFDDHGLLDMDAWGKIVLAVLRKGPDAPVSDPLVQLAVDRLGRNNGAKLVDLLRDFGLFTLEGKDHVDDVLTFAQRYFGDNEDLIDMLEIVVASEKPKRALRRRARFAALFTKTDDVNYLPPLLMRATHLLDSYLFASPADQVTFDWDGYEALAWLPVAVVNEPHFSGPLLEQIRACELAPVLLGIMLMAQAAGRVGRHVLVSSVEYNDNGGKTCGECDLVQQVEWVQTVVTLLRFADDPDHGPVLPKLPLAAKKCLAAVVRKHDIEGRNFSLPQARKHGKGLCERVTFDMMPWTLGLLEKEQSSFLDDLRREFA